MCIVFVQLMCLRLSYILVSSSEQFVTMKVSDESKQKRSFE